MPTNSAILPAGTAIITHARILRMHRTAQEAALFHNYVGAMSS